MSKHIADTVVGLEIQVGESLRELPDAARAELFTQAIYQLAGRLGDEVKQALDDKVEVPFVRGISVELLNLNSRDGQNALDKLGVDPIERPH